MNSPHQHFNLAACLRAIVGAPGVLTIAVAVALYSVIGFPGKTIVIATGPADGYFHTTALAYQAYLQSRGFKVRLREQKDTLSLVDVVNAPKSGVDIGFIAQEVDPEKYPNTRALGVITYKPVLIFYRASIGPITSPSDLKGLKVAANPPGSGTRQMAESLLAMYGVTPQNTHFHPYNLNATVKALIAGEVDAGFLLQPIDQAVVTTLADTPGIKLLDLQYSAAIAQRLAERRVLKVMTVPKGYFDLRNGIPKKDMQTPAEAVTVVVKKGMDPGILHHVLLAMKQVHGGSAASATGDAYPSVKGTQIPLHEVAESYYNSGLPFLYKYLPFQLANALFNIFLFILPLSIVGPALTFLGVPKPIWFLQELRCQLWLIEMRHMLKVLSSTGELTPRQMNRLKRICVNVARQKRAVERCREILGRFPETLIN
ncbi:TAXI family TRAP transporter solute-binding subunit [Pseudomonas sp. LABIM340]|uniref:TAXI family TRAP transporter solute-binding subunit n=1 Tax=Pseudomonas sp. LABIM340 TaxID=3156585 RepID=UPI0032AEFED3